MHDRVRVGLAEAGGDLFQDRAQAIERWQRLRADDLVERLAGDELHGDEDAVGKAPEVVDPHDVRVGEPAQQLDFAQQAVLLGGDLVVLIAAAEDGLDRDLFRELAVARAVDPPHAAASDLGDDLVAPGEQVAGREGALQLRSRENRRGLRRASSRRQFGGGRLHASHLPAPPRSPARRSPASL